MNHNEVVQKLFNLLGKSEKDTEVIELLNRLGIQQPLPRAHEYTGSMLLEDSIEGMHIGFTNSEDLPQYEEDNPFMEGELIFTGIYINSIELFENEILPLDLNINNTLQEFMDKFGKPESKRSYGLAYRWGVDNLKLLLEFDEDNEQLIEVNYMIPQSFHI